MHSQRRLEAVLLGVFQLLIGLGAVGGGTGAVLDPSGSAMGISTDVLVNSPFDTFLVPGLFLLIVLGLGNIGTAAVAFRRWRSTGQLVTALGVVMVLWIVIQVYMMWSVNAFHVAYFIVGTVQAVWGGSLMIRLKLWPFRFLVDWHKVSDA